MTTTNKEKWVPSEKPFRLSHIQNAPAPLYWRDINTMFATEEEARAAFSAPSKIKGLREVVLDVAANAETWSQNGHWKRIAFRKPYRTALTKAERRS